MVVVHKNIKTKSDEAHFMWAFLYVIKNVI